MAPEINFPCRTCGDQGSETWKQWRPAWAAIAGYGGCVDWLDDLETEHGFEPKCDPPIVGGVYRVRVRHPFRTRQGETFWALFEPPVFAENGWEDAREDDLSQCRLVRCEWTGSAKREDRSAIIEVRVREVMPYLEIAKRFPEHSPESGGLDLWPWNFPRVTVVSIGPLSRYEVNHEGDAGVWLVCREVGTRQVVILYGEWGWHEDFFYVGQRLLTSEESERLQHRTTEHKAGGDD